MPRLEVYYCSEENNIGQVREEDAHKEVERMKLQTGLHWKIIDTKLFVESSDLEDDKHIETSEGYVWVVTE